MKSIKIILLSLALAAICSSTFAQQQYKPVKATKDTKIDQPRYQCTGHTKKVGPDGYYLRCKNTVQHEGDKCRFHQDQK